VIFLGDGLPASRPLFATLGLGPALHQTIVRRRLSVVYVLSRAGYDAPKNSFDKKLSPVLRTLLSSPHPRPHEGLSRVVLKVRAGSGACGGGRPNLGSGRLSQTAISRHPPAAKPAGVDEVKPPSDPPVRHYDRAACFDGLRADRDGRRASEIREVRDAKDRNRRTRTPGDRFFKFRNGRSAPVSSLFAFRARGLRATAMTHAS
jgi:hypothetical protein